MEGYEVTFRYTFAAVMLLLAVQAEAFAGKAATRVTISIDKRLDADGTYNVRIIEIGVDPHGDYTRHYSFAVVFQDGLAPAATFSDYVALMKTQIGRWETPREPVAGYLFAFRSDGKLFFDVQLVEDVDKHLERMKINGVHQVEEPR